MIWFVLGCIGIPFVISVVLTALLRRWAPAWGLVDQPAARKMHTNPTPLGGGIAIYLATVIPVGCAQLAVVWLLRQPVMPTWMPAELVPHLDGVLYRSGQIWGILAAGGLLVAMGLLDDRFGLSWKARLTVQLLIAIGLVSAGVQATVFVSQPLVGAVFTVFWIVLLINSLNFLDNMDALSSGIGLIASVMFATIMLSLVGEPRWFVGGCLLLLAGSLAGFLCHNWPPAKIFMGDAGSTFIGLMLATLTIVGTFYDESIGKPHVMLAPLCILAVPLYDFTSVMLIRLSEGRSPFQPDKCHFSHRLVEMGLSRKYAVLTVHFATITTGLGALLLYRVADWNGAALVVALVLCVLMMIAILETAGRKKRQATTEAPETPASA
ncbi:MAG: undecaprenyl/decaprenyl-phosphate alpha-N-acetylglucosaminyl 1-phosphate transferase [Planctomycetaceae bacterium]|nr:undecaprenyl/decaprenyl-phosphate alpha-N-acetylglucosaminyl 1-phosphate transferase [Planctomycetaceae bacterium]